MLVTFSCPAYANITMFGDIAVGFLKMMGHSGSVPGAILAEDLPKALKRLKAGIDDEKKYTETADDDDQETAISLSHRALPLIELLTAAIEADCHIMWDQ